MKPSVSKESALPRDGIVQTMASKFGGSNKPKSSRSFNQSSRLKDDIHASESDLEKNYLFQKHRSELIYEQTNRSLFFRCSYSILLEILVMN